MEKLLQLFDITANLIGLSKKRNYPEGFHSDSNERVLTDPFRRLSTEKDMSISMVGLDAAGKTIILYKLGEIVNDGSFPGYYAETLVYDNITLKAWDVSGRYKTRLQGSDYFKDTKCLIFVVDSNDKDRLDQARYELNRLLNEELLKDVVLVFANKQDLANGMNKAEITGDTSAPEGLGTRDAKYAYCLTCRTSIQEEYKECGHSS